MLPVFAGGKPSGVAGFAFMLQHLSELPPPFPSVLGSPPWSKSLQMPKG